MELTVPNSVSSMPSMVSWACRPFLSRLIWLSSTLTSTFHELVATTTNGVELLDDELLEPEEPLDPAAGGSLGSTGTARSA